MPEEARKEIAAGTDEQGLFPRGFDLFGYIIQQLTNMDARYEARFDRIETRIDKLDTRIDKLDSKIDTQINALRQEMQENDARLQQEIAILRQEIKSGQQEIRSIHRWSIASIVTTIVGLGGGYRFPTGHPGLATLINPGVDTIGIKREFLIKYFKQLTPEQKMKMVPQLGRYAERLKLGIKRARKNGRPDN